MKHQIFSILFLLTVLVLASILPAPGQAPRVFRGGYVYTDTIYVDVLDATSTIKAVTVTVGPAEVEINLPTATVSQDNYFLRYDFANNQLILEQAAGFDGIDFQDDGSSIVGNATQANFSTGLTVTDVGGVPTIVVDNIGDFVDIDKLVAGDNISLTTDAVTGVVTIAASNSLSGLTDTTIGSPTLDEVLKYNGTTWVNGASPGGGGSGGIADIMAGDNVAVDTVSGATQITSLDGFIANATSENYLTNGGFEDTTNSWTVVNATPTTSFEGISADEGTYFLATQSLATIWHATQTVDFTDSIYGPSFIDAASFSLNARVALTQAQVDTIQGYVIAYDSAGAELERFTGVAFNTATPDTWFDYTLHGTLPKKTQSVKVSFVSDYNSGGSWADGVLDAVKFYLSKPRVKQIDAGQNITLSHDLVNESVEISSLFSMQDEGSSLGSNFHTINGVGDGINVTNQGGGVARIIVDTTTVAASVEHYVNPIDQPKSSNDTPDDDFDGGSLAAKWTLVMGATGSVSYLGSTSGADIVDLSTRQGYMLLQSEETTASTSIELRQDYEIPDGSSIILAVDFSYYVDSVADNESRLLLQLNDDDSGGGAGNRVGLSTQFSTGWSPDQDQIIFFDNSGVLTQNTMFNRDSRLYFRISRVGLDYTMQYSKTGNAWNKGATSTSASALNNIWIRYITESDGDAGQEAIQSLDWIRQGTNSIYPFTH